MDIPTTSLKRFGPNVGFLEPLLLFQNTGNGLRNVSAQSGPLFGKSFPARGLALGDFNNDGAVDVLISMNNAAPLLLKNEVGAENQWLGVNLNGSKSNRDAIGAVITWQAGDIKGRRMKVAGGSYLSYHDPRIVLGLGQRTKMDWLEIKWPLPSGAVERLTDLPIDRYITIVE